MKKVLVADDETEVLSILEKRLRQNNYDVITAANGKDAILAARSGRPDVMLLDIAMPDMDGYALAAALKEDKELRDVPIIFVTGKELEPKGIEGRISEIGAFDYIMKPCSFGDILAKIKAVVG
jgi:DNA-binding response OmpR family regulator